MFCVSTMAGVQGLHARHEFLLIYNIADMLTLSDKSLRVSGLHMKDEFTSLPHLQCSSGRDNSAKGSRLEMRHINMTAHCGFSFCKFRFDAEHGSIFHEGNHHGSGKHWQIATAYSGGKMLFGYGDGTCVCRIAHIITYIMYGMVQPHNCIQRYDKYMKSNYTEETFAREKQK